MIIDVLAEMFVDVAVFLEFSGEGIIEQDASLQMSEQIALSLSELTRTEVVELKAKILEISKSKTKYQDFISKLPELYGFD